jgi:hypothetical protein
MLFNIIKMLENIKSIFNSIYAALNIFAGIKIWLQNLTLESAMATYMIIGGAVYLTMQIYFLWLKTKKEKKNQGRNKLL